MVSRFHKRGLLWVVVSGLLLWSAVIVSTAQAQEFAPGRMYIIVPDSELPLGFAEEQFPPITTCPCLNNLNEAWGYLDMYQPSYASGFRNGTYIVVFPDSADIDTIVAAYRASGCLDDAYPMVLFESHSAPNDSLYYHVADTTKRQWALDRFHTRAEQAWDITTGDSQLVIAVIDEGVFWEHPDLTGNMWINDDEDINNKRTFECWSSAEERNGKYGDLNGVDDDGNGYIDDVVGLHFLDDSTYKSDVRQYVHEGSNQGWPLTHGTNVASIIAARTNNVTGLAGIAGGWGTLPGVRIMAVAMEQHRGKYTDKVILEAVGYAKNAGADIISMSWGISITAATYTPTLRMFDSLLAVAYFDSNIICVATAGNNAAQLLMIPAVFGDTAFGAGYPAAWRDTNRVIGVGAIEVDNIWCTNSNYGPRLIDVGAPGTNWYCRVNPDTEFVYGFSASATSWAGPLVAGVAGLVRSAYPGLGKVEVIRRMREGCSPMNLTKCRSGNIDALKALSKGPASPWGPAPVQLYEDFIVAPGETLLVEVGTRVYTPRPPRDYAVSGFDTSRVEIIVYGTLVARSIKNYPIIFQGDTAAGGGYNDWGGIIVRDGGKVIMDTVIIKDATTGIRFDTAGVCSVRAVTISHCQSFGIDVASENVSVRSSRISDIDDGYGIRVNSGAKVNLYADTIQHAYGGIEFYATRPCSLDASLIDSCEVYGVYTQSDSLAIRDTRIREIPNGTGICGEGSTVNLFKGWIHDCDTGMTLDQNSGGLIEFTRFGIPSTGDRGSVALSLACSAYVYQTGFTGAYSYAAVKVLAGNPVIYRCKLAGDDSGTTGLWVGQYSRPKVRCTDIQGWSYRDVDCYRAHADLGREDDWGNNMLDPDASVIIEAVDSAVTARYNYYIGCPPTGVFEGPVDHDGCLGVRADSCAFDGSWQWDTISPPGGGENKLVAPGEYPETVTAQNYPNPFNAGTVIRFVLPEDGRVRLEVFDILGRHVRTLLDEIQQEGTHTVSWDGTDRRGQAIASGMYFYRLTTAHLVGSKKMILLK